MREGVFCGAVLGLLVGLGLGFVCKSGFAVYFFHFLHEVWVFIGFRFRAFGKDLWFWV